jgi:hypothetical protein
MLRFPVLHSLARCLEVLRNGTYPNGLTTYGDFNNAYNNDYNVNYTYYPNPPPDYSIAYGAINNSCMTIPGVERYP